MKEWLLQLAKAIESVENGSVFRTDGGSAEIGYLFKVYRVGTIIRVDIKKI
jgi:hypothetical protein